MYILGQELSRTAVPDIIPTIPPFCTCSRPERKAGGSAESGQWEQRQESEERGSCQVITLASLSPGLIAAPSLPLQPRSLVFPLLAISLQSTFDQ